MVGEEEAGREEDGSPGEWERWRRPGSRKRGHLRLRMQFQAPFNVGRDMVECELRKQLVVQRWRLGFSGGVLRVGGRRGPVHSVALVDGANLGLTLGY